MRRAVVWTESARADLAGILRHIAGDNPDAAKHVSSRVRQAVANLEDLATGRAGRVAGTYEKVLPGLPYILACKILVPPQGRRVHCNPSPYPWRP